MKVIAHTSIVRAVVRSPAVTLKNSGVVHREHPELDHCVINRVLNSRRPPMSSRYRRGRLVERLAAVPRAHRESGHLPGA